MKTGAGEEERYSARWKLMREDKFVGTAIVDEDGLRQVGLLAVYKISLDTLRIGRYVTGFEEADTDIF